MLFNLMTGKRSILLEQPLASKIFIDLKEWQVSLLCTHRRASASHHASPRTVSAQATLGSGERATMKHVDRAVLSRVIAVMNGKGGVGKTSLTANLAGLYAAAGYRVLVLDCDPQGNLGVDLGYLSDGRSDGGAELVQAITEGVAPRPMVGVRDNLDVLPGGDALNDLAVELARPCRGGVESPTPALAASLAQVAEDYDLIFIDSPPGGDVLQHLILTAARWIIVPTRSDDASRIGLRDVARRYVEARRDNPHLALLGVVLFGVNISATRITGQAREALARDLNGAVPVLESMVRYVEAAATDARNRGQLVHELEKTVAAQPRWFELRRNPEGKKTAALAASAASLAGDYAAVAREVLHLIVEAERAEEAAMEGANA
jgi:chromosome partitioning protein